MSSAIKRKPVPGSGSIAYSQIVNGAPDQHTPKGTVFAKRERSTSSIPVIGNLGGASHDGIKRSVIDFDTLPKERLKLFDPALQAAASSPPSDGKHVKWGFSWQEPSYVAVCALSGIALALGHHFYYRSLDGTSAGSSSRQQWALTFGTSFSFLVVHLLASATLVAYSQYIWKLVRQRAYTLQALDDMFAAGPRTIFDMEVWRYGRLAIPLGIVTWIMGLAAVTPPATLTVVSGWRNKTTSTPWPALNWSSPEWMTESVMPTESIFEIATRSATDMTIVPISPPALNSSYHSSFYGPSLQCNAANATQQAVFDYVTWEMTQNETVFADNSYDIFITESIWLSSNFSIPNNDPASMIYPLAFTAFAPNEFGWYYSIQELVGTDTPDGIDRYNNWGVSLPSDFDSLTQFILPNSHYPSTTQQLWIQTTNQGVVCVLGNASYEVDFEYVNGVQTVSQSTSDFVPLWMPKFGISTEIDENLTTIAEFYMEMPEATYSYVAVFTAFSSLLSGNLTLLPDAPNSTINYAMAFGEVTSRVLDTALSACSDLVPSYWFNSANFSTLQGFPADTQFAPPTGFDKPTWMCRNGTLAAALEDLFSNITISMFAANISDSTNETISIKFSTTHNIYQYNSLHLVISYSIAIALTILCIVIGSVATIGNGVIHNTSFSAIVVTTRNSQLDRLAEGKSLGALPLDGQLRETRLRFGELTKEKDSEAGRIGFGLEEEVTSIRRGEKYT